MLSELEQKEFAKILEFQAMQENTIWMIEGEGETLDGMKVVKAMMENKKEHLYLRVQKVCGLIIIQFISLVLLEDIIN